MRALIERVVRHSWTQRVLQSAAVRKLRSVRWRTDHERWLRRDSRLMLHNGSIMHPMETRRPMDASAANAEIVLGVLDEHDIPYTEVRRGNDMRSTVAIPRARADDLVEAFSTWLADEPAYASVVAEYAREGSRLIAQPAGPGGRQRVPVCALGKKARTNSASVLRVWRFYLDRPSGLTYGPEYGCEIELWEEADNDAARWKSPRMTVVGDEFSSSDVVLLPRKRHADDARPSVLDRRVINDVDFPIDVVYTWVDNSDATWRAKLAGHTGQVCNESLHEQASGEERFRSRDELKYSLRSLSMYAPWVRHVFIVTDGQVPEFLDFDREGITLVDHADIATAPEALPVFNSSAIISWLHHIDGLSEHYIYMNDDVFFGRDVAPTRLFTPSGLARVFPSKNRRPFGEPNAQDEPHLNITRNIRALLEEELGRTISQSVKHTPHAQLVSVHDEMEKRFWQAYDRTARSRFRHHDDIAPDQLFHYYAQMTGRAVVGSIRYAYVNTGDDRNRTELDRLLQTRAREVFCLNDVAEPRTKPMSDATVREFLEAYFPIPSVWERQEPNAALGTE